MKKIILLLIIVFTGLNFKSRAQDSCITAFPICSGTVYNFDSSTGIASPSGPDYGCLSSTSNPLWFSLHVTAAGSITVTGAGTDFSSAAVDIDFIYWGPFSSLSGVCYSQLDAAHTLGCDYSTSNLINVSIPSATVGSYYIGMVSNYSNNPANISLSQTGGTGSLSCSCFFNGLTAVPTTCNAADGTYNVSGAISFTNAPSTGTLTVFGNCGGNQVFTAPFTSPQSYSFTGLTSNGASCFVSAAFSANSSCSMTTNYTAPPGCSLSGVNENTNNMSLTLSPNPSSGIFDLSFESPVQNVSVFITDISGRIIYQETLLKYSGSYKKQIDLSSFSKGIYFVKVQGEKGSSVQKLIYN